MLDYIKKLITPDMVSLWVPSGQSRAIDLVRGNHGQCYGTNPNVPVISPPIEQINACDADDDWSATAGGALSIDEVDFKEGTGSLKNTVASPSADTWYNTIYSLAGSRDWSAKEHILVWFYCDIASTAFSWSQIAIYDALGAVKSWQPLTFSAGVWTPFKLSLSNPVGSLASVVRVQINLETKDDTPFYLKLDDLRVTGKPSLINPSVGWHWDGINDRIVVPNHKSLDITGNEITIGFWIWISVPFNQYDGIIAQADNSRKWTIKGQADTSAVRLWLNGNGVLTSPSFSLCEWHRVIATYDNNLSSNQAKIYIDGDFAVQANRTGAIESIGATDIWIGREATYYFDGYIVLPFVAKRTGSPAQVKNDHLNTKSLFAPRG